MTLDDYTQELHEIGGTIDGYFAYLHGMKDGLESIYQETNGKYGEKGVEIDEMALDRNWQVQYMTTILHIH